MEFLTRAVTVPVWVPLVFLLLLCFFFVYFKPSQNDITVISDGDSATNFDDKAPMCSANQYLRILMSKQLLNDHVKQMDIPPRMVGIDDIEWRSPYAKSR